MRKTKLLVTVVLIAFSILLLSSCMTTYSWALGVGAVASMASGPDMTKPVVTASLNTINTAKFENSGENGLLMMNMANLSYSFPSKTLTEDCLFGPAFEINLNNPEIKLSIGVGPVINITSIHFENFAVTSGLNATYIFPSCGVAASLRFGKLGISGFISANLLGIGIDNSPLKFGIKGGVFVTAILKDVSL